MGNLITVVVFAMPGPLCWVLDQLLIQSLSQSRCSYDGICHHYIHIVLLLLI